MLLQSVVITLVVARRTAGTFLSLIMHVVFITLKTFLRIYSDTPTFTIFIVSPTLPAKPSSAGPHNLIFCCKYSQSTICTKFHPIFLTLFFVPSDNIITSDGYSFPDWDFLTTTFPIWAIWALTLIMLLIDHYLTLFW